MLLCHKSLLKSYCTDRGYTLDEVMQCVVAKDGDEWTIDVDHPAYPRTPKAGYETTAQERMPDRTGPGFLEKVKNFATAAVGHVAAGMPMASDAEIIRRHDICLGCEFLVDNACTQCGCPVSRVAGYVSKLSWADQSCPVGKWGAVPPSA